MLSYTFIYIHNTATKNNPPAIRYISTQAFGVKWLVLPPGTRGVVLDAIFS